MNSIIGAHDVLFLVLDTLRFDVAARELGAGRTPHLARLIGGAWEKRHTPGSFTFAAHQAFFAGFLPTPADATADQTRLFASSFEGSETTGPRTKVVEAADWISALAAEGYRTMCVGGVGFFNLRTELSRVLPGYFAERAWEPRFGVTDRDSTQHQFEFAAQWLGSSAAGDRALLFVNVSALHQPNYFYARESGPDDLESHAAALRYVDSQLPVLLHALARRQRQTFFIVTSDHGTAYGEDGWTGHRLAHPEVWTVPYAEGVLP
ncbi:MAG: hypothetical protein QOE70_3262 [Chthoniobacter sp.]|jgi:predicted AlkP superfamily pyrophosphatase or phosphodiesterase|nr:hypothetical protein [Chthoniobacter sp.]